MPRKKSSTLFEDSLKGLEEIVEQLEQGDISLEESLKSFEQGVKLTGVCQKSLQEAEQKVQSTRHHGSGRERVPVGV